MAFEKPIHSSVDSQDSGSGLRQEFIQEKARIISEYGDLEQIRSKLGLNQRRICRLLLVDPSAWTRWLKSEAPPHIYQALKWLLELKQINPHITNPGDFNQRLERLESHTTEKLTSIENLTFEKLEKLEQHYQSSIQNKKYQSQLENEIFDLKSQVFNLRKQIENLQQKDPVIPINLKIANKNREKNKETKKLKNKKRTQKNFRPKTKTQIKTKKVKKQNSRLKLKARKKMNSKKPNLMELRKRERLKSMKSKRKTASKK